MNYIHIQEVLSKAYEDKKVNLRGWVYRKREQKQLVFIILRDNSNTIQCVIKEGSKAWKAAQKITIESSCTLSGIVHQDKRAPTGYELQVDDLEIVGLAERYPISKDLSEEFLLDVRHLWLRSRKMTSILKIRSKVFDAIHEFFRKHNYYEFQSPIFQAMQCEGGSTLFEVDYFGKSAYLAQTWQLYAEPAIFALEKIYCISPSFRAEKSITTRHLTEFWHAEVETAWQDFEALQKQGEELMSFICQKVSKDCRPELKERGLDYKEIEKIKAPFPRITYTEAIKLLKKEGMEIEWGKDLRTIEEQKISAMFKKPVIVTHYPKVVKAFYMKEDPKDKRTVQGYDMLAGGLEIIGGSTREDDIKEITKKLKDMGEDPEKYKFYLDTRRYGSVPHSGFGMGVERVLQWLCKLPTIRDAIAYPCTPRRLTPATSTEESGKKPIEGRLQTAEHVLLRVIKNQVSDAKGLKSRFKADQGTLEIQSKIDLTKMDKSDLEADVNGIIVQELKVTKVVKSRDLAQKEVDIGKIPESAKEVRIVEIEGFDKQACRDPHVDNTGEIGEFVLEKIEKSEKDKYRFTLTVR